jgi:aryl-alcohol dehydrogenase-like predicted oxidoreductase
MERHRFGNSDLMVSAIGLGCYGMSGAYGLADDTESIATIRRALDLGVNFLDTSASYGNGHNHRLIGEAIKGRRQDVVIHSKSGSPRGASAGGGGDARYLRETCETSLRNLGVETLDVFCMSRIDPHVPVEDSVAAMAALVKDGKTRFIALSECSAESLRRGSAVHPLVSLQMEYSLFSRDAERQGQIAACQALGAAMMAYAVLGRGLISAAPPPPESLGASDVRAHLPRFEAAHFAKNLPLRTALEALARRKGASLAQLAIAWTMAMGKHAGAFVVPIPGAKSRVHLEENIGAAALVLTEHDLAAIDRIVPPGAASGTRYPESQMHRINA